jgi:hypothetical protein
MADTQKESTLEKLLKSRSEALRRVGLEIQQQQYGGKDSWPDTSWSDGGYSDAYGDFWSNSSDGRWWNYKKQEVKKDEAKLSK